MPGSEATLCVTGLSPFIFTKTFRSQRALEPLTDRETRPWPLGTSLRLHCKLVVASWEWGLGAY